MMTSSLQRSWKNVRTLSVWEEEELWHPFSIPCLIRLKKYTPKFLFKILTWAKSDSFSSNQSWRGRIWNMLTQNLYVRFIISFWNSPIETNLKISLQLQVVQISFLFQRHSSICKSLCKFILSEQHKLNLKNQSMTFKRNIRENSLEVQRDGQSNLFRSLLITSEVTALILHIFREILIIPQE